MRRLSSLFSLVLVATMAISSQACAADAAITQLQVIDHTLGKGALAQAGETVKVNYTGWLYDAHSKDHHGTKFDSSYDSGEPIEFPLGNGMVIAGWDQGIAGMHVGGTRTLVIPAALGYGSKGAGEDIPPDATLIFDVELVGVNQ